MLIFDEEMDQESIENYQILLLQYELWKKCFKLNNYFKKQQYLNC